MADSKDLSKSSSQMAQAKEDDKSAKPFPSTNYSADTVTENKMNKSGSGSAQSGSGSVWVPHGTITDHVAEQDPNGISGDAQGV